MRRLSVLTVALLAIGCSSHSAALMPNDMAGSSDSSVASVPRLQSEMHPLASRYSCPAKGTIVYLADYYDSVIDIFAGAFAGQSPCGQIKSSLNEPVGLYVQPSTHDLYVANHSDQKVLVFHRGQKAPYNIYIDRYHAPEAVLVGIDGTVIDLHGNGISTWIAGPNGGKFVGDFPLKTHEVTEGLWITLQANGTIFYDVFNYTTQLGELWTMRCPAGQCHHQTQVAGVSLGFPGGMAFDNTGKLLVVDSSPTSYTNNTLQTFDLPNPSPSTFPLLSGAPMEIAISKSNHHVYIADEQSHNASEYSYPSGALIGTVTCCVGTPTGPYGIAVDP